MSTGENLKKTRIKKDLTVKDAAAKLNISPEKIKALEEENYSFFASSFYARSFLKNYAEFLGVEIDHTAEIKLDEISPIFPGADKLQVPEKHTQSPLPKIIGVALILVLLMSLAGIYLNRVGREIEVQLSAPEAPAPEMVEIRTVVSQPTWVRVLADGVMIEESLLTAPSTRYYTADESLRIRIGYTRGMDLYYRNRPDAEFTRVDIDSGSAGWVNELEFTKEFSK